MKHETRNQTLGPKGRFLSVAGKEPDTGNSPAISVIVPIYNMEKLMRKCLDSILAQSFEDYECLLIDDGSKDGSPVICDEYAAKDPRIKAFHKPNGGLSDARNYGLERAQGDYTIFFDPDDWVDADCLKDMYAKAVETDADMVMCDLYYNDPYRQSYCKQEPLGLDHFLVLKSLFSKKVSGFTVTKLIKKHLYDANDVSFPYGLYGCEDLYTMSQLLKNDIKIVYLPKAYYHYMHYGNESQSRRYDENTYQQDVKIRDMFDKLLMDTPFFQIAHDSKTLDIFLRAFYYGNRQYSSASFHERFSSYEYNFSQETWYMRILFNLSLRGNYVIAWRIWKYMCEIKRIIKLIIHKLSSFSGI